MTRTRPAGVAQLLDTPNLADALESDQFKQFLDRVPIAIAVSELSPAERLVYANIEFENLTGRATGNHGEPAWGFSAQRRQCPRIIASWARRSRKSAIISGRF